MHMEHQGITKTRQALIEMMDVAMMFVRSDITRFTVCVALISDVIHGLFIEVKVTTRTKMTSNVATKACFNMQFRTETTCTHTSSELRIS